MNRKYIINYQNDSQFRLWLPILPAIIYWAGAFLNYHFGLVYHEALEVKTYVYLGIFFSLSLIGYALGNSYAKALRPTIRIDFSKEVHLSIFYITAFICIIGLSLLAFDRAFISGITISRVLEETAAIRDDTELSALTTFASPFAGLQLAMLVIYMHRLFMRQRVSKLMHCLILSTLLMRLFISFVSTNRLAFVFVLCWILFFLLFIVGSRFKTLVSVNRKFLWKASVITLGVITGFYIIFISRHRTDENYLYHSTKLLEDRFDLRNKMDPQLANAILTLSTYSTQQFIYIDRALGVSRPLNFQPHSMFTFFLRQFARFGFTHLYFDHYNKQFELRMSIGFSLTGWPSLPGFGLMIFGYIGFPIFILIISFFFGFSAGFFVRTGSVVSLSWCFLFFNYALTTHMGIPSDQYLSLLIIFAIISPALVGRRLNKDCSIAFSRGRNPKSLINYKIATR